MDQKKPKELYVTPDFQIINFDSNSILHESAELPLDPLDAQEEK